MRTMRGGFDTDLFRDSGDVRRRGMTEQSEKTSENPQGGTRSGSGSGPSAGHHQRGYGLDQRQEERRTRKGFRSKTWT